MREDLAWILEKPIAHRGMVTDAAPENSLGAFKKAVETGHAIELDVYGIRKGGTAVFHDTDLLRMCKRPLLTELRTEESLKKYKLRGTEETIPTFKEVLEVVDGKVGLLIELKVYFRYKKLCNTLIELLKDYDGPFAFCGFSTRAMRYLRKKCDFPLGMISMNYQKAGLFGLIGLYMSSLPHFKKIKPDFLSYQHMHVPSRATKKARAAGIPIICWTIHSQKQYDAAAKKCDNVIVDTYHFPDMYKIPPKQAVELAKSED